MATSRCGKHTTLSNNEEARLTQCTCGTVHILVKKSGLTVQISEERFHQVGLAVMGAVAELGKRTTAETPSTGRIIN